MRAGGMTIPTRGNRYFRYSSAVRNKKFNFNSLCFMVLQGENMCEKSASCKAQMLRDTKLLLLYYWAADDKLITFIHSCSTPSSSLITKKKNENRKKSLQNIERVIFYCRKINKDQRLIQEESPPNKKCRFGTLVAPQNPKSPPDYWCAVTVVTASVTVNFSFT